MSRSKKVSDNTEFDPTEDPTNGELPATEFPPDEFPDPDQTPEDQGTEEEN
jgi:hypothetical protein